MFGRSTFASRGRSALSLACLFAGGTVLCAHPEIDDALARLNPLIAASPENAELYLQRGDLYAKHEDWVAAEANYLRAAELAPTLPRLARSRGALALATKQPREAQQLLHSAIDQNPRDAEAWVLRSRAHACLRQTAAAIADLDTALRLLATPPPELFLERAALQSPVEAIRGLDAAIAQLGPVVTLQLRALALEESLGRIEAAADRLAMLAAQSERKETWLKRRGDLFARAGRVRQAADAYAAALAAITALPEWLRASPDTVQLTAELTRLLTARS